MRGERKSYVIVHEILPTMTSLILASFLGAALYAVLFAAGLQFIGLGDPNSQSWGTMLYWAENNEALGAGMPYWAIMPGVCIALLGAAFALLNYAFDEVSSPALRLRKLERQGVDADGAEVVPARPQDPKNILEVRNLSVAYASEHGPVVAVDDVSFELAKGEFLGVVGESACGKSTLVYAIARLLGAPLAGEITNGQVLFKGQDMVTLSDKQLRHIRWRDYSVVMQSAMNALNPVLTIGAQMRDACEAHSTMSKRQIEGRSKEVLRLVSIDPVHLLSYPHQLSGGMRQRAMIAMALLFTPELIVMDEPTSALDVVGQRSLMVQIKELQEQLGFAVIFVTHDMSLVRHFSDRLLVMYAAQVAELGRTRQLFEQAAAPVHARACSKRSPRSTGAKEHLVGIPGSPPDLLRPAGRLPLRAALPARVRALRGRAAAAARGRRRARPLLPARAGCRGFGREGGRGVSEPLLRVEGLTRHFRVGKLFSRQKLHAVDDVGFELEPGEIVALVGESGSGKSTIARLLARVYKPTAGEIYFQGKPVSNLRTRRQRLAYASDVAMVFQDPYSSINPAYRVTHPIERGLVLHRREVARRRREAEVERSLAEVGLLPAARVAAKFPHELSGGQRQRVGFASALAVKPKLIVADEPVSMLDVSIRIGVLNLMTELREREGVSFLYITHDVASARYVADRVLVLYAGHLVEEGPAEEVIQRPEAPVHAAAPLGRARPARRARHLGRRRRRRAAEGDRPAAGLPFPRPLPLRDRGLRDRHAAASGRSGRERLVACHVAVADAEDAALERV